MNIISYNKEYVKFEMINRFIFIHITIISFGLS